jgi:hypothetical protein
MLGPKSLILATTLAMTLASLFDSALIAAPSNRGPLMPEASTVQTVMTFQAWKGLRLEEARLVLERLTQERAYDNQADRSAMIERAPGERQAVVKSAAEPATRLGTARAAKTASRSDSRIEQAQMNLEIAQDLTVNDYLQIYLSRFRSREALLDVARRMAPEEVVDLLLSYQKLSSGAQLAENTAATATRLSRRPL